jgi:hypothetical protein
MTDILLGIFVALSIMVGAILVTGSGTRRYIGIGLLCVGVIVRLFNLKRLGIKILE